MLRIHFLISCLAFSMMLSGQDPEEPSLSPELVEMYSELSAQVDALDWKTGQIELGRGLAQLQLSENFRYLGPEDTTTVLEDIWGNPTTDQAYLGMLFPANQGPLDEESWAVVIEYEEDGYVRDDDAKDLDYGELLTTMKKAAVEESQERTSLGLLPIRLIGWAEPPHFDAESKKLYWAREFQFGDETDHTLNYDIRVLGRKGVLVLTAVGQMSQLDVIRPGMEQVVAFSEFREGHRYADFNPSLDKVATYGIAGLIAGKVALKAGFFKGLIALLIAGKKLILVGFIAIASFLSRLFGRNKEEESV